MSVASGIDKWFEHAETAGILDSSRLEAHPADLNYMNVAVDAPLLKRDQVPAIIRKIDQSETPRCPACASVILHLQVTTAERISMVDAMTLSRDVDLVTRFEFRNAVRNWMEVIVEIYNYPPGLVINEPYASVVTIG